MKRFVIGTAILLTWAGALAAQPVPDPSRLTVDHGLAIQALFDLKAMSSSPFPSDWYTVPDPTQNTGLRVNLPKPSCTDRPSDCEDIDIINELDGFNVYPRLSIPFSGPIDLNTVSGIFLIRLGSTLSDGKPGGQVVGIDQVVFEPTSNTLYVESDALLDQHTRYLLVVTKHVLDEGGKSVKATTAFLNFVDDSISESTGDPAQDAYRATLRNALAQVDGVVVPRGQVVAASVFTTQSTTAVLEKIRDQIHAATPGPATFLLGPEGYRTVFDLSQVTSIVWNQQTGVDPDNPSSFTPTNIDLTPIQNGDVGSIAFGKYVSADYLVHPYQYIPAVGTRSGTPKLQEWKDMYFNLYLPSGSKPLNGWPVAIFVPGIGGSKEDRPLETGIVSSMAKHGFATIVIDNVGHGCGPQSTVSVSLHDGGAPVTFPARGQGIDQNGDKLIGRSEGAQATASKGIVSSSDSHRQSAADLMQLVREIQVGMDVDSDGRPDVDASRIYLFGTSWGGGIATVFFAVEPDVRVGVLNVPFDPVPGSILSCVRRNSAGGYLSVRKPSLLNPAGVPRISALDGCLLVGTPLFNENFPLKNMLPLTVGLKGGGTMVIQSPVTNDITGAMEIQEALENAKWVGQAGSPLAYAPYLRKAPLAGMQPKSVIFQMAKGDQSAHNPSDTAIARAGDLADRTLYFRHDLYHAKDSTVPMNPHSFATSLEDFNQTTSGVQDAVGQFFESDGTKIVVPEPREYFEFPVVELPESLNFSSIK